MLYGCLHRISTSHPPPRPASAEYLRRITRRPQVLVGCSADDLTKLLLTRDYDVIRRFNPTVVDGRDLEWRDGRRERVTYIETKPVWPLRPRDFVCRVRHTSLPDGAQLVVNTPAADARAPVYKGLVRGELRGIHFVQPRGRAGRVGDSTRCGVNDSTRCGARGRDVAGRSAASTPASTRSTPRAARRESSSTGLRSLHRVDSRPRRRRGSVAAPPRGAAWTFRGRIGRPADARRDRISARPYLGETKPGVGRRRVTGAAHAGSASRSRTARRSGRSRRPETFCHRF